MTLIMTRIEIPIRLSFQPIPTMWEIRRVEGGPHHEARDYAFPRLIEGDSPGAHKIKELDPWVCRDEFFSIQEKDKKALLKFLGKVGVVWLQTDRELADHWSKDVMQHYRAEHLIPIDVGGLWKFRESLKRAMTNKTAFKETYAPLLADSEDGVEFPLRLELTNVASGALTLTDAYHALLATVFFDVARGIPFKTCERKDCGQPFPLESKHEKKFCSWYCAHITTVRKNRPHSKKKARKSLPRKRLTP